MTGTARKALLWARVPLAAFAAAVLVQACSSNVHTFRYRLTVEVETPDGMKSGSSVIEASSAKINSIDMWGGSGTGVRGEAVFVDLGRGRNVVALLAVGPKADINLFDYLAPLAFGKQGTVDDFEWLKTQEGSAVLPEKLLPTLVTFGDLNDPKSVQLVEPKDFEAKFGPGYHFATAKIELTKEPVTTRLRTSLPLLDLPGRPAVTAWKTWIVGRQYGGTSAEPESFFERNVP